MQTTISKFKQCELSLHSESRKSKEEKKEGNGIFCVVYHQPGKSIMEPKTGTGFYKGDALK